MNELTPTQPLIVKPRAGVYVNILAHTRGARSYVDNGDISQYGNLDKHNNTEYSLRVYEGYDRLDVIKFIEDGFLTYDDKSEGDMTMIVPASLVNEVLELLDAGLYTLKSSDRPASESLIEWREQQTSRNEEI